MFAINFGTGGFHMEDDVKVDFTKRLCHFNFCFCPLGVAQG